MITNYINYIKENNNIDLYQMINNVVEKLNKEINQNYYETSNNINNVIGSIQIAKTHQKILRIDIVNHNFILSYNYYNTKLDSYVNYNIYDNYVNNKRYNKNLENILYEKIIIANIITLICNNLSSISINNNLLNLSINQSLDDLFKFLIEKCFNIFKYIINQNVLNKDIINKYKHYIDAKKFDLI